MITIELTQAESADLMEMCDAYMAEFYMRTEETERHDELRCKLQSIIDDQTSEPTD